MKPAAFEYHRPQTVSEATELLRTLSDVELMAGNQSLSIVMSNRLATPDHIIDINGLDELQYIDAAGDAIEIGAMARHRDISASEALTDSFRVLPDAADQIAGPVVRNRGTLGGSIGEADPAGNYPCVLVAMAGELELASTDGRRTVDASDYFLAYMMTAREETELITSVRFPTERVPPARTGMAFDGHKAASQTWPTLSVAGALRVGDPAAADPVVENAQVGYANAADVPLRLEAVEAELEGEPLTEESLAAAGDVAYEAVDPQAELHADERYKRELAREYTKRVFETAFDRATADRQVVQ
jgi:carbon-monoxide dehydrogenase medium subunit